jgi:hypothetical protein
MLTRTENNPQKNCLGSKISIIGAGAAGLSAAFKLKEKGYENITLFESGDRVGGKCFTKKYGGKTFDLGAGWYNTKTYKNLARIVENYNIKFEAKKNVFFDNENIFSFLNQLAKKENEKFSCADLLKMYHRFVATIAEIHNRNPGFYKVEPQLCVNFAEWLDLNHFTPIRDLLSSLYTSMGYGFFDEIPTIYVLKLFELLDTENSWYHFSEVGYQGVWDEVAKEFNVKLNSDIKNISRDGIINIQSNNDMLEFDSLLVACPYDELENMMRLSNDEKILFNNFSHCPYLVTVLEIDGLADFDHNYLVENQVSERMFHVVLLIRHHSSLNIYTAYQYTEQPYDTDSKELEIYLHDDIKKLGGQINKIIEKIPWKYFPHVKSERLSSGFFDGFEAMQGDKNTFYLGEALSFSDVEHVVGFSFDIIDRYF